MIIGLRNGHNPTFSRRTIRHDGPRPPGASCARRAPATFEIRYLRAHTRSCQVRTSDYCRRVVGGRAAIIIDNDGCDINNAGVVSRAETRTRPRPLFRPDERPRDTGRFPRDAFAAPAARYGVFVSFCFFFVFFFLLCEYRPAKP